MRFEIPNIGAGKVNVYTCRNAITWFAKLGFLMGVTKTVMDITAGIGKGAFVYVGDRVMKKAEKRLGIDKDEEDIDISESEERGLGEVSE